MRCNTNLVRVDWYSKIDGENYILYIDENEVDTFHAFKDVDDRYYSCLDVLKCFGIQFKELKEVIIYN